MNRYASTVALYARMNLIRVLVIMVVTAAVAAFLIWRYPAGGTVQETYTDPQTQQESVIVSSQSQLDEVIERSRVPVVCGVGFAAIVAVMSLTGCGYGVKTDCTVRRLRVNESSAVCLWAAYHAALLIVYWAVLAAVLYGMMALRCRNAEMVQGMVCGSQSMLLLCYTDTFLHRLIPMRDGVVWVVDMVMVLVTALGTVHFSYSQRHGRFGICVFLAVGCTVASFFCPMGNSWNYILLALALVLGTVMCYAIWGGEDDAEKPL